MTPAQKKAMDALNSASQAFLQLAHDEMNNNGDPFQVYRHVGEFMTLQTKVRRMQQMYSSVE